LEVDSQSRQGDSESRLSIDNPQINLSTASEVPRRDDEISLRARAADASELRISPALNVLNYDMYGFAT